MAFQGVYTAIVTPFKDGRVDRAALTRVVEHQLEGRVDGIVACGTTGESATLSDSEILSVTRHVVDVTGGACKVVAGVGSNNTQHTVDLVRQAQDLGIDGALIITPYYNKPSQHGLEAHFRRVSEAAVELPLMLYTVPGRTGVNLNVETFARLDALENVVSLKDATADLALSAEYIAASSTPTTILSGDDITALPLWAIGGEGVVSVAANLYPRLMVALWHHFKSGQLKRASHLHLGLIPLFRALFLESNPAPVKHLMAEIGILPSSEMRLPLVPVQSTTASKLASTIEALRGLELEHRA